MKGELKPIPKSLQNFVHFDCVSPVDEPGKRFHHFTTQVCPRLASHIIYLSIDIYSAPPRRLKICCTKRQYHRFRALIF